MFLRRCLKSTYDCCHDCCCLISWVQKVLYQTECGLRIKAVQQYKTLKQVPDIRGVNVCTGEWCINDSVQTRWRSGRWEGSVTKLWFVFNWCHLSLSNNTETQIFMQLIFICLDIVWKWNVKEAENVQALLLYYLLLQADFNAQVECLLVCTCGIWDRTGNRRVTCIWLRLWWSCMNIHFIKYSEISFSPINLS